MPFVAVPLDDEPESAPVASASGSAKQYMAVPVDDTVDITAELDSLMESIPKTGSETPEEIAGVRANLAKSLEAKNSPRARQIRELGKGIYFGQKNLDELGYSNLPQPVRRALAGTLHGAASFMGPAARAAGQTDTADSKRGLINKIDELNNLLDEESVAGPLVGNVGQSLVQGTTMGPYFAAGYGAEAVDQALLEAKQKGMNENQAFNHAASSGAIGYLFPKVGGAISKQLGVHGGETLLPSSEYVLGKAVGRSTLGKLITGVGIETGENVGQMLAQNAEQVYSGVNPNAFDNLPEQLGETAAASVLGAGTGFTIDKARNSYFDFKESVPDIKKGEESGTGFINSEPTPRQIWNAEHAETQQEFYEATGIKRASKPFREAFKDILAYKKALESEAEAAATKPTVGDTAQPQGPTEPPADATTDTGAVPPGESTSSVKQAAIERDRELMGMIELQKQAQPKFQEAMDLAREHGLPERAVDIAEDILENHRAPLEEETAGMAIRMQELKNQIETLQEQVKASSDPAEQRLLLASQDRLQNDLDTIHKGAYLGGSIRGSQLNFQKLVVNKDFSLGSVRARLAAAKGDTPVTPSEKRVVTAKTDKLKNIQTKKKAATAKVKKMVDTEKASPLGKVIEDIGNFHRGNNAKTPEALDEIQSLAKELAGLAQGARSKSGEKHRNKKSNLQKIKELRERLAEIPGDQVDATDRARTNKALDKLEGYYGAKNREQFVFGLEKKFGRPFSDAERAELHKFYDQLGYNAQKIADQNATFRQLQELEFEEVRIKNDIQQFINLRRPKTVWQKVLEPFHFARAVKVAFDLPPVLRQGGFLSINPLNAKRAFKALADGYKAIGSEFHADSVDKELKSRPNAPLYESAGLFLHREDTTVTGREESFMSKWAENIPGFKASQRGYTTFLNRLRADTFDAMIGSLTGGKPTIQEAKAIANFVNVATGRGGLGASDKAMEGLTAFVFAPRYTLSRMQLAIGQPLFKGTARTRKLIAKQYAGTLTGAAAVMLLATAAWGDREDFGISFDPDSPDFMKIKLGRRTRLDPFFGMSQTFRAMRAFGVGTHNTFVKGGEPTIHIRRGKEGYWVLNDKKQKIDGPYKTELDAKRSQPVNPGGKLARYGRTHAAPLPGLVADVVTGENTVGDKVDPKNALVDQFFPPLSARDVAAELREEGFKTGGILSLLSLHGGGSQIYGPPEEVKAVKRDGKLFIVADNDIYDKAAHLTLKKTRDIAGPYKSNSEAKQWLKLNGFRRTEGGSFRIQEPEDGA